METTLKKTLIFFLLAFFLTPALALAHQPRITESRQTPVPDPEISKAYYGKLTGEPDVYIIKSSEPFDLYVNVLVPDISGQTKDVSAMVLKDNKQINVLDGTNFEWEKFYEPFGADSYFMGPEYKARAEAGTYEIRVTSPNNDSKYSLAIGEIEAFDFKESLNALKVIPELKKNFFNESPIGFIVSPFGWGLILIMYGLAFIIGLVLKFLLKKFLPSRPITVSLSNPLLTNHNINTRDRVIRLVLGVILLLIAMSTTWNPILIFISGFCVFESFFSWCGLYAALGKNSCPIN